jgi:hypothetical protein
VRIIGRTRDWLRYEVPKHWIRREWRSTYKGQKQIWFLLRLVGRDSDVCLRANEHPEFDAWRWNSYWVPLGSVIEFKRGVYEAALMELARLLFVHPRRAHPALGSRYRGRSGKMKPLAALLADDHGQAAQAQKSARLWTSEAYNNEEEEAPGRKQDVEPPAFPRKENLRSSSM